MREIQAISDSEKPLAKGNLSVMDKLAELMEEYENILWERANGDIIRAKADWADYGEKNSKLFIQLENRNQEKKHIKMLITDEGMIDDPKGYIK